MNVLKQRICSDKAAGSDHKPVRPKRMQKNKALQGGMGLQLSKKKTQDETFRSPPRIFAFDVREKTFEVELTYA